MRISRKQPITAIAIFALLFFTQNLKASTGELYGYGSRASAMGNTLIGGSNDGYATFYVPSANSTHKGLLLSFGLSWAHPSFTSINNVVIANGATSGDTTSIQMGDVDTNSYLDHLGQVLGASYNFGENLKSLTVGVTAFMPIARVAYLDSSDPFLPDYFSYRSRTQRPQIYGALSVTPFSHFHAAGGVSIATNLSANNTATITAVNGTVSHQRFASTIKPGASPYFSLWFDPNQFNVGLTARMPSKSKVSIDTTAHARLLANTNDIPLVFNSSSSIYYDPLEFDLGIGYTFASKTLFTAELDWINYAAFESPILTIVMEPGSGQKNSTPSSPGTQNILVPKFAFEHKFEKTAFRAGYMFRPSPIKDNSGNGNLVDPSRHTFTAGIGLDLQKYKITSKSIELNLHAQYHQFVSKKIEKSAGNEVGNANQARVGSPSYEIGGRIFAGGLSLTANF